MSQPYAAGAIVSTVDDLARWDHALARGMLLKPESLQRALKPFALNDGSSTGYGYGWDARAICPAAAQWHDGGIEGYASFVLRIPEQGVFVAVLSNCEEGIAAPEDIAKRVAGLMLSHA